METPNFYNINFNNNEKKNLSLAYGCRNYVAILDKFDADRVTIFSFKKHTFADRVFTLMLIYRKQSMQMPGFFQMLQYLVATYSIDIIAGGFNYDLLKVLENKLLDIFTDHLQMVNKPTHISASLIGHIYIKESLMEEFFKTFTFQIIML